MTTNKSKRAKVLNTLAHGKIVSMEPIQGSLKYEGMGDGRFENERMVLTSAAVCGLEAGKKVANFPKMPDANGRIDWQVGDEPSGIVWIVLRPSNSKLAKTAKKAFATDIDNGHKGGVKMWIRRFDQSYVRNVAYAEAFAGYLRGEGYDAVAGCTLHNKAKPTLSPTTLERGSRPLPKVKTDDSAITLLRESLQAAMKELRRYAKLVNLKDANNQIIEDANNINESVFRFLVLLEIMKRDRCAKCQTEWKTYDLVATIRKRSFVIEFKFWGRGRIYNLTDMKPGPWKGGPSKKNEGEFCACLEKLRKPIDAPIDGKVLVLLYQSGDWKGRSFKKSYDNLERFGVSVDEVEVVEHCYKDHVVCKLIKVE